MSEREKEMTEKDSKRDMYIQYIYIYIEREREREVQIFYTMISISFILVMT